VKGKPTQTKKRKEKAMTACANYKTQSPEPFKKYVEFNNLVKEGAIEEKVRDLVAIRASQLNVCASCQDTFRLRNASGVLPDRSLCKSFRTTSRNEGSPN
jgi:alkylhydroperoxidase family enzyme